MSKYVYSEKIYLWDSCRLREMPIFEEKYNYVQYTCKLSVLITMKKNKCTLYLSIIHVDYGKEKKSNSVHCTCLLSVLIMYTVLVRVDYGKEEKSICVQHSSSSHCRYPRNLGIQIFPCSISVGSFLLHSELVRPSLRPQRINYFQIRHDKK